MPDMNRRAENEKKKWGNLFGSLKGKVCRQGLTVAQARATGDVNKVRAAERKLEEMHEKYYLVKSLLRPGQCRSEKRRGNRRIK